MKTRLAAALLAVGLILCAMLPPGAPAAAQGSDATLVINLTSDDVFTQQMALSFASNYMGITGNDVAVFLNVRAAPLANENVPQHTTALTEKTPQALLGALMDKGAKVFLCPGCTRQSGLTVDDRIEGVEVSGPAFHEILAAPGTRVMSY